MAVFFLELLFFEHDFDLFWKKKTDALGGLFFEQAQLLFCECFSESRPKVAVYLDELLLVNNETGEYLQKQSVVFKNTARRRKCHAKIFI